MSKVQTLRVFVKQRLTAAAEEIFELFERTIAEYEEELCRHRKLLDAVYKPQVQLHRTDVQQLLVIKEEQQERSSSLDQEDPPEPPPIKENQEELWTRQEAEQLPGLQEEDDYMFTLSPMHVNHEEEPNPESYLQPVTDDETSHLSEPETDDSSDWETRTPQEQESSCPVCKKTFSNKFQFVKHMRTHTEEKRFHCPVCGKAFARSHHLKQHEVVHTGEKPFGCSICGKKYTQNSSLTVHFKLHTGERKPHRCSVCETGFSTRDKLIEHIRRKHGHDPVATGSQCSQSGPIHAQLL